MKGNKAGGCDRYFDGLVCWPDTPAGHQAHVDCFIIEAFAQAIKFAVEKDQDTETGEILCITTLHIKMNRYNFYQMSV